MNKYIIIATALPILALASCTSEDDPDSSEKKAVSVYAGINSQTRAHDVYWDAGDAIGIFCNGTHTKYNNMKYVTADGDGNFVHDNSAATGIFFQSPEDVTFYAYYPYSKEEGEQSISADINVEQQSKDAQKTYDYLYASGATASRANPNLSFTDGAAFKHMMTRLVIKITTDPQSGFSASDVADGNYSLGEIPLGGRFSFDMTNFAKVEAADSKGTLTLADASEENNTRTYDLILFPGDGSDLTFTAVIDGQTYTCQISPALAAGTKYTYSISVKKTGLQVINCQIVDWATGTSGSGTATM